MWALKNCFLRVKFESVKWVFAARNVRVIEFVKCKTVEGQRMCSFFPCKLAFSVTHCISFFHITARTCWLTCNGSDRSIAFLVASWPSVSTRYDRMTDIRPGWPHVHSIPILNVHTKSSTICVLNLKSEIVLLKILKLGLHHAKLRTLPQQKRIIWN